MTNLGNIYTWMIGIAGTIHAFVTEKLDLAFQILLLIMLVDIISGIMKGIHQKRIKSSIMSIGIIKKGAIILSIIFAYLLDLLINDAQPIFVTMMTWLAIGNEGLSIIENLSVMGVGIPKVITKKLNLFIDQADLKNNRKNNVCIKKGDKE